MSQFILNNSKKLAFLSGLFLMAAFLMVMPRQAKAAQYDAGWYEDIGVENDAYCTANKWRAYVQIKDASSSLMLSADTITITAKWYQTPSSVGVSVYSTTSSATSSIMTGCIDTKGTAAAPGTMVLTVDAGKAGYYTMSASNVTKTAGPNLSQKKWSKTVYLAPLSQNPNLAYMFPVDNQWLSTTTVQASIFVRKKPGSNIINDAKIEFLNSESGQRFYSEKNPNIAEGTTTFAKTTLPQGSYIWKISLMKDDQNFLYNESSYDLFRIDSIAPTSTYAYIWDYWYWNSTELRMVNYISGQVYAIDSDNDPNYDLPVSGIKWVGLYINNVLESSCTYNDSLPTKTCGIGIYDKYGVGTYNYYFMMEDVAGNRKATETRQLIINPPDITSALNVRSYVCPPGTINNYTSKDGAYITLMSGPVGAGNKNTEYTFETTTSYQLQLMAPATFDGGKPFSFWYASGPFTKINPDCGQGCYKSTVHPGDNEYLGVFFGTSLLIVYRNIDYGGNISSSLRNDIRKMSTKMTQLSGGTPNKGLDTDTLEYDSAYYFYGGQISNVTLQANNSTDTNVTLKFDRWAYCDSYPSATRCNVSISYDYQYVFPYYVVQRTLKVLSYVDGVSKPGVIITSSGGIPGGTTNYTFQSTSTIYELNTVLTAPNTANISGKDEKFDHWEGCSSVQGAGGRECVIDDAFWYNTVSQQVIAHYGQPPEAPTDTPVKKGELRVKYNDLLDPVLIPLNDATDSQLYFIKNKIASTSPLHIVDQDGNIKVIDLLPVDNANASPVRIKLQYTSPAAPDGIWALRKW
jgi:hypothetical protein